MSTFYSEDICAFKSDPAIVGTVEYTWSEVDLDLSVGLTNCYIYKDLPPRVRKAWFEDERLPPGYVIIAFLQQCDGHCLVHESFLSLIDRSLAVGDTVKKSPSDAQSGTIISTSLLCTLQPLCDEAEYNRQHRPLPQGHIPSHGPHAPKHKSQLEGLVHGLPGPLTPARRLEYSPWDLIRSSQILNVPAQELKFWNAYREEDFIIFDNWVGQVEAVYDEVTVRLSNGSVVVVEDPEELEEPYWIPGTSSYELAQRLDRAGFYQYWPKNSHPGVGKPRAGLAEPCYPGQYVQTKKGNLRCGRWKFGAYDPTVPPRGIVVDVRCIELEIRWLYPNQSLPLRDQVESPPGLLGVDELESGRVIVYDRSRLPRRSTADELPNASYSRDTGFGHRMRFRDPAGAAIKYGHSSINVENKEAVSNSSHFHRIPRSATQGFDMNVFQVTSTSTTAMVRWQDCTVTVEKAIDIKPYLNPDEHDVWPGDKVSYIPEEAPVDDNTPGAIRIRKVGVVQRVDAAGRIATVRWFKNTDIVVNEGRIWTVSQPDYGEIGEEFTEVSLYDIAAHSAVVTNRGDGAIIIPNSASPLANQDRSSSLLAAGIERARGILELAGGTFGANVSSRDSTDGAIPPTVPPTDQSGSIRIDWCGEIIDLCLDGQLLIRLGAAAEVRDVKLPPGRILVVPSENEDDDSDWTDEEGEESGWTDEMSLDESETDLDNDGAIDVLFEYEGVENLDEDGDDAMWTTDEEENEEKGLYRARTSSITPEVRTIRPNIALEHPDRAISFKNYSAMPESFAILEGAPDDHHFTSTSRPLTASLMRRIAKENEIIQQSLPDGVFVRTWESRLDLLRVLIVGPYDTPYEFAPFVFDLQYGQQFPTSPPSAFFHSWTGNLGRVNPNLYEDGTICLSLLGTWNADKHNEAWSSKESTVLQLIVSLMGLVLVKEPYYNEAGFEVLVGSEEAQIPSALYNEKVYVMSKGFIKKALTSPLQGVGDIIHWLYSSQEEGPKLVRRTVEDARSLISDAELGSTSSYTQDGDNEAIRPPVTFSAGALILLRRNVEWLEDYLLCVNLLTRTFDLKSITQIQQLLERHYIEAPSPNPGTTDRDNSIKGIFEYVMALTAHEYQYGVHVERLGTSLPYGVGVYFGPNRIMAAMALARENTEVRTQIDNLSVVASVAGSLDYQSLYRELQAYYVKSTLVIDDSLPVKVKSNLVEDESPLVKDEPPLLKEINQEPPSLRLQNIFLQQLWNIQQCAERNLRQHVRISAISLPSYWYEGPKRTVLGAATQLNINIPSDMLLCHEETARLAYNLESLKKGTWSLVFVEYNSKNLCLTIAEMSDREDPEFHPKYPVDGRYLLEDLGEASPTRATCVAKHYTNIGQAFNQFILRHFTRYPLLIDKFSFLDIKGIILTGDATGVGMRAMEKIFRQVFADHPQCSSGNIFTNLRPSHVMALGTARAVRSKRVNGEILRDVYEPVAMK